MAQIPGLPGRRQVRRRTRVAVLKAQGRSITEVEGLIRRQVQLEQLDSAMRATSFATGAELEAPARPDPPATGDRLADAARGEVRGRGRADEADIKAYYDPHKPST